MKKHIIAAFLAIVMCVAMLVGCSLVPGGGSGKDVQVVLKVNGEVRGVYTVNSFNNAVVDEPAKEDAPEGTTFLGWTPQENWEELEVDEIVVASNKGLIRFDDVKNYVKGAELSVTLYAAFVVVPPKDLVVAWYRAEGVSTQTGLTQEIMDSFTENMYTYLESKDYTPSEMDIVVRAYDGNVGTSCGNITSDGDVNIMVGWAANIDSTGGMTYKENVGGVEIGTISRYAARLDNNYLTRLVYVWILNTYGGQNLPEPDPNDVIPDEPDVPDVPDVPDIPEEPQEIELPSYTIPENEQFNIVIAWYEASASGLTEALATEMEAAYKAFLQSAGLNNVNVEFRKYDGDVKTSCGNIMTDGDVDIMIGWGKNIGSTGEMNLEGGTTYFRENIEAGLTFGEKTDRYVATITDNFITDLTCAWVRNTYKAEGAVGVDYPAAYGWAPSAGEGEGEVIPPIPAPESTEYSLVIGWYSKSATSGLTLDMMTSFVASLGKHLTEAGYGGDGVTVRIELRDLGNGGVADVGAIVNDAGDFDIIFGMGNNITSTAKIEVKDDGNGNSYRLDGVTMGTASRNIAIVASSENEFAVTIYNWLLGENSDGWLYSNEAKQVGIYIGA